MVSSKLAKNQINVFEWFNSSAQISTDFNVCFLFAMKTLNLGNDFLELTGRRTSRPSSTSCGVKKTTDFQLRVVNYLSRHNASEHHRGCRESPDHYMIAVRRLYLFISHISQTCDLRCE
jgi:hypothetical protein